MMSLSWQQAVLCYLCLLSVIRSATGFSINSRVFVSTPVSTRRFVKDCMTPQPKTVTESTSVNDAMAMLLRFGIQGAPVVSDSGDGVVVGVVSSRDFLQKEAFGGSLLAMGGSPGEVEGYADAAKRICATSVGDVMTENPVCINREESMKKAAEIMAGNRHNRLPVLDDDGNLVGILTASDVMRDLLHIVQTLPEAARDASSTADTVAATNEEGAVSP